MVFMLDTCVINRILDGRVGNEWSLRGDNFVTDIQLQEILDTKDPARRRTLLYGLIELHPNVIRPTDAPQWLDGGEKFDTGERFLTGMGTVWHTASIPEAFGCIAPVVARALPANSKRPENPLRDGFIVEAAMLYGMTLVTADTKLGRVARRLGIDVELVP